MHKYATPSLTAAERLALGGVKRGSRECLRCLHASQRALAQGYGDNASGSPAVDSAGPTQHGSAPSHQPSSAKESTKRGSARQQRAAMVSDEVRTIARGTTEVKSAGAFRSIDGDGNRSQGIDDRSHGNNVPNGAMGEGPNAQGVGRIVSSDIDDVRDSRRTQHDRRVQRGRTEPADESPVSASEAIITGRGRNYTSTEISPIAAIPPSQSSKPFRPATQLKPEAYLHSGAGSATIAAGNFEGVLADRFRIVADPAYEAVGQRHPPVLARKLMRGQLINFASEREKAETLKAASRAARRLSERKEAAARGKPTPAERYEFAPLPEAVRQSTVDKLVLGKYDPQGVLDGKTVHKSPVLNEVAKATLRNGTFLASDGERLLRKVQSLLPTTQPQQSQRPGAQQQARR